MKTKILYLPLDERPCNSFAQRIMSGVKNYSFVCPEKSILGNKKTPANFSEIRKFLLENAKDADICVMSVDCLLYGGIVPSRLHNFDSDELRNRLNTIVKMKQINPQLKIYAFALIMRCPSYSSDDEEPSYYEQCGKEIFLTGQVKHKLQEGLISQQQANNLLQQYLPKCGEYIEDFENRRAVNLHALVHLLDIAKDNLEYLIIPQDDSAPYGYTSMDREVVKKEIAKRNLVVANYPGADEVGMTLVARAVTEREKANIKVKCVYADDNAKNLIPLYEDRQLGKTVVCQLQAANCSVVEQSPDITLFLNYPAENQVHACEPPTESYSHRNLQWFCEKIAQNVKNGGITAVADGAYGNGGDIEFLEILGNKTSLFALSSYAGWNTSSNTLGTAICQAVIVYLFGKTENQNRFLAERYFEDVGYCAHTRAKICSDSLPSLGLSYFDAGQRDGEVAQLVKQEILRFMQENFPEVTDNYTIDFCQMPWKRMFEVALTAQRITCEKN